MMTLVLGPFAFAGDRLALLAAAVFVLGAGAVLSLRVDERLGTWAMSAVVIGFVTARLAYVFVHPSAFVANPVRILMVSDGGFALWAVPLTVVPHALHALRSWRLRRWSLGILAASALLWSVTLQLATATSAIAAPGINLPTLAGETIALSDFLGRPVVVNLWATWCPPCRREMPMLVDAAGDHPEAAFVFANQGEGAGAIIGYLAQAGFAIPNLVLDQSVALARHYGIQGYPATLFLDADGTLQTIHFGEITREALDAKLDDIASSKEF